MKRHSSIFAFLLGAFATGLVSEAKATEQTVGGVMTHAVGTGGTMYFEPAILPGQPQLFYKVETIQKK